MKRTLLILIILYPYLLQAQPPVKKKNYPSLLWEITGKGLRKPSFLFGTMHVSSKMAFHLADSFYVGIHNADMVALETNPESWQEDMSKYDLGDGDYSRFGYGGFMGGFQSIPEEYFGINTLKFYKYDKKIERTLYSNPSTINNLLYRTYGNKSSDFEEDTYLDMYIYQCGKKWGKKIAGVEKYGESMKLMAEAYKDAAKDHNKKERSYDVEEGYSSSKLQEAYRTGNLDWLDSINKYNSFSSAFDEKFLYRRNEIQAGSIDSILRTGQSLFVGVGAAHLPGTRGVIEMLRRKGYNVRPVKMVERDSQHKNDVERLRVPVVFNTQVADDGIYKVDIPGKFYKFGDDGSLDQRQYADMANGSYYMVTRIMTNAWMWGHNTVKVLGVVDSLLYENVPGKIIAKTPIVRNGYKGFDIVNKTRRGDLQRYNIFITPFEIIVFKMSGTGDYVRFGDEAKRFFGSIQLKEFSPAPASPASPAVAWKKYSPSFGGFLVNLPHDPYIGNDGSWIYDAEDKNTNTEYRVIRTDIHNYHFAEEDTFDLGLMEESFAASDFIDKEINRQLTTWRGYPALDASFKDKSGNVFMTRFIIQGPHYYTLIAHGKQETGQMKSFMNSFEIKPLIYKETRERHDTSLYYTVKSPLSVYPESSKEKIDMPHEYLTDGEPDSDDDQLDNGVFRTRIIANDTTGEKILVAFVKVPPYSYTKDSTTLDKENRYALSDDTSWIVRSIKRSRLPDGMRTWETTLSDTGSSRMIWNKGFYKDGIAYLLSTQSDTLTPPSDFVKSFFNTFNPADTLEGINPFAKKTPQFFTDFFSPDSSIHQKAIKGLPMIDFDSTDIPMLKKAIGSVSWKEKNYIDLKKSLVGKLSNSVSKNTTDYLRGLYYAAGDTVEIQYAVLDAMLMQKTNYSYNTFRDIITNEPPVITFTGRRVSPFLRSFLSTSIRRRLGMGSDNFTDELYDSLALTKTILPDLLPLMNLDDYKSSIMGLLGRMVDSNMVKAKDYESYFSKFLLEAKQKLKRQSINEKKKAIRKAEKEKDKEDKPNTDFSFDYDNNNNRDAGNDDLSLYATLLLPFWDSKPAVQPVINQMLASNDKQLKYSTFLLLVRNHKSYPDSMLNYFASMDDYRYDLYDDLKSAGLENKFPASFNNHIDLAKGKLLKEKSYDKPDSLVYLDQLPATVKGKKGVICFFKYKKKKDDAGWRFATVGLLPEDAKQFEFTNTGDDNITFSYNSDDDYVTSKSFDFTGFRATRINEEKPLDAQLKKELKRVLYSHRKSAKAFYTREDNSSESGADVSEDEDNN